MPKAFPIPPLPALPKLSAENLILPNEDINPIVCPEGFFWVPVAVGSLAGHYCVHRHKVVAATGTIYTPTGFECAGGKENNRKWRLSIRILLPSGERGRTLGMWLVSHQLDYLIPQSSPRKSGSSYRSSEDNSGGHTTTGTSSGFGSSQGTGSLTLTGRPSPEKRYRSNDDDISDRSLDEGSPSKMLRKAFFSAPNGNSLDIPEPTPPPLSPNPADVIGRFMAKSLALHSPPNPSTQHAVTPGIEAPTGLPSPPRKNYFNPNNAGATPTPMHTPESPQQLQSLPPLHQPAHLLPLGHQPYLHSHLHQPIPHHQSRGGSMLGNDVVAGTGVRNPLESYLAGNTTAVRTVSGTVISTGVVIYPSRIIDLDYLDPEANDPGRKNELEGDDGARGGNLDLNNEAPVLGRGARRQQKRATVNKEEVKGDGVAVGLGQGGRMTPNSRRAAVPVNASSPRPNPYQHHVYSTTPMPTAAALAAARAASAQHHVEAIDPLPFFRQESGSSLDLARVFDYGDYSPGGFTGSGFTPLQRSPGGGSADWDGGVQSITFSLGGNADGMPGPHCGQAQNNDKNVNTRKGDAKIGDGDGNDEINVEADGGGGDARMKKNQTPHSDDSPPSIGKATRTSSPPEMLDVFTPEGEAAAEEAAKKMTAVATRVQDIHEDVRNRLFDARDKKEAIVVEYTNLESSKRQSPRLTTAAKEAASEDEKERQDGDGMELSNENSSGSNLGDNDDGKDVSKDPVIWKEKKREHPGLHAEDSAVFDQRENADVQII